MTSPNMRLYSPVIRQAYCTYYAPPGEGPTGRMMRRVVMDLEALRREEPAARWRIETQGTVIGWHPWKGPEPRFES